VFVSISKVSHYLDSSQTQTHLSISLTSLLFTFAQAFFTSAQAVAIAIKGDDSFKEKITR
jgi:hypothetical protein